MSEKTQFSDWWRKLGERIVRALGVSRETSNIGHGTMLRAWDGSPSRWSSTEDYCASCLIDVNAAAGRDEKAQSHCKLPVKNPGEDSFDFEGIRAAAGGHGVAAVTKPDDVPQDDWDRAVKSAAGTIISQYEANGETAPDSVFEVAGRDPPEERALNIENLYEALWLASDEVDPWAWPHGLYHDDGGLFGVVTFEGKLWKAEITIEDSVPTFGEWVEVVEEFRPRTRKTIHRQADGRWRWFSISATAVLNRVGEIDSRDLFDSFIAHAEETGEYPYRTFFHLGEDFRMGQSDFLAREGNCYLTSGVYDDPDENILARAEIAAQQREPDFWGESIGYRATEYPEIAQVAGIDVPVFRAGINVEISTVPGDLAASLFTSTMIEMEVKRMTQAIRDALMHLFNDDEELVEQALAQVDDVNRSIDSDNLVTRQIGELDALLAESIPDDDRRAGVLSKIRQLAEGGDGPAGPDASTGDGDQADPDPVDPVQVFVDEELAAEIARRVPTTEAFAEAVGGIVRAQVDERLGELVSQVDQLNELGAQATAQVSEISGRLGTVEQTDADRQKQWLNDLPAGPPRAFEAAWRPSQQRMETPGGDEVPTSMADQAKAHAEGLPTY